MTISTMEALTALPVGAAVKVQTRRLGNRIFTRTADGFEYEGTTIEPQFFTGHVEAGHVVDYSHADPEPGDHFHSGRYRYIVVSIEDQTVWLMQFVDDQYQQILQRTMADCRTYAWRRVTPGQRPGWHDASYALGVVLLTSQMQATDYARQLTTAQNDLASANLELQRSREARAAQVAVVVNGVSRMPLEKADGHVPDKVTVVDVLASWRREFTVTTEPVAGCQCGTITREQVIDLLGISGQSEHADFGFQTDCGRHS